MANNVKLTVASIARRVSKVVAGMVETLKIGVSIRTLATEIGRAHV